MDVTVDEFVTSACDYVFENCGLDVVAILTNIPDINAFAEFTTKVFQLDTVEMRESLYDKRDQYWEEGNTLLSNLCNFLAAYMSIFEKCEVYAMIDSWMRGFEFCVLYDLAANSAPLLWNYNTRRFRFDYQGSEWMIRIWKGNYLINNGGEVGLYNRNPDEKFCTFYECATDDQLLEMSLEVYHGEDLLVYQEPQMHWWVNGFTMKVNFVW